MAEMVIITHPDVDGQATVSVQALPGYAARGWLLAGRVESAEAPAPTAGALFRPAANASADAWRTYAVAASVLGLPGGLDYEQAMDLSRDQLVAQFASLPDPAAPAENPAPATTPEES